MNPSPALKRLLLLVLFKSGTHPLTTQDLHDAARVGMAHDKPTNSEVDQAIREMEVGGWIIGARDEFTQIVSWTVTQQGDLKARQLA